jgi:hypothetical protein
VGKNIVFVTKFLLEIKHVYSSVLGQGAMQGLSRDCRYWM